MPVKLDALIKKTEAAIATEQDPKKLRTLQARLSAFVATRAEMDDDGDDNGNGDDDDDDEEDESKAKKAAKAAKMAKKASEAAKHRAKAAEHKQKAAEYEEAAKKVEEDEDDEDESEEEAEARYQAMAPTDVARAPSATAGLTPGAAAALASQAAITNKALADIAKLKRESEQRSHSALIADAKANRRITPNEAKMLAKKPLQFVREFLEMRGDSAVVPTEEEDLSTPRGGSAPDGGVPLTAEQMLDIDQAIRASGITGEAATKLKAEMVQNARKELASMNGAGRY